MLIQKSSCVVMMALLLSSCSNAKQKSSDDNQQKITQEESTTMTKKSLPSGLAYTILHEAPEGAAQPKAGQHVSVHYTGWLDDGQGNAGRKFDSSVDRGQKFTFVIGVGQVIRGWDEGVMDMKVGEKRRLYIPASLGYGSRGAGAVIPPNAALIFDVELFATK